MRLVLASASAAAFAWAAPSFAIEEVLHFYRGIRSAGMGGVITTTGNYDEALYGNPARHVRVDAPKLSILGFTAEANDNLFTSLPDVEAIGGASGREAVSKAAGLIGRNQHARAQNLTAYYDPAFYDEMGVAAGLLASAQTNLLVLPTTDVATQTVLDSGLSLGLANSYCDRRLSLGLNLHVIYRMGADKVVSLLDLLSGKSLKPRELASQGVGVDADFGAYYKLPWEPRFMRLNVGASVNGLLQTGFNLISTGPVAGLAKNPVRNERVLNLGLRADLPDAPRLKASLLALEFQEIGSLSKRYSLLKRLHMGGETKVWRRLAIRAGLYQGYLAGGFGLDFPLFKIDFATYAEEIGAFAGDWADRRYLVRVGMEI